MSGNEASEEGTKEEEREGMTYSQSDEGEG